jgi:serine phosphatase RsbU (regulator of sigma subunit)
MLYLATDGFIDQNNASRKKLGVGIFKYTLQGVFNKKLSTQLQYLEGVLDAHQGGVEQRDDITLLGIRL